MQLYRMPGAVPIHATEPNAYWRPDEIGAWAVETNKIQRPRIQQSPLVPSLIIETRHHYQVYFVAKGARPDRRRAIVEERLVPFFSAQAKEYLPAPSSTARVVWKHGVGYSEVQMARAFAWRRSSAPRLVLDPDVEARVLGAVILRPDLLVSVPGLEVDDFSDLRHKVVFQAARNLEARSQEIDVVMLENEIEHQGKLDAVGGIAFLGLLVAASADAATLTPDLVRVWANRLRAVRLQVLAAIAKEDERLAEIARGYDAMETEIDEFALRDVG